MISDKGRNSIAAVVQSMSLVSLPLSRIVNKLNSGFRVMSLKFKHKTIDPTEILLSRCIRAAEN